MITTKSHKTSQRFSKSHQTTSSRFSRQKRDIVLKREIYKFKRLNHEPIAVESATAAKATELILRQQLLHSDYEKLTVQRCLCSSVCSFRKRRRRRSSCSCSCSCASGSTQVSRRDPSIVIEWNFKQEETLLIQALPGQCRYLHLFGLQFSACP